MPSLAARRIVRDRACVRVCPRARVRAGVRYMYIYKICCAVWLCSCALDALNVRLCDVPYDTVRACASRRVCVCARARVCVSVCVCVCVRVCV